MEYARSLRDQAKILLEQENELVSRKAKRSSDRGLLEEIMRSGTLNDKISALTLKVRGAPLHHMTELGKLLSMMARNNRRESLPCLNSFKDLCVGNLLPSDRKLKFFEDQPLSGANVTQRHIVLWYFEDYLKKAFYNFLLLSEVPYTTTPHLTNVGEKPRPRRACQAQHARPLLRHPVRQARAGGQSADPRCQQAGMQPSPSPTDQD